MKTSSSISCPGNCRLQDGAPPIDDGALLIPAATLPLGMPESRRNFPGSAHALNGLVRPRSATQVKTSQASVQSAAARDGALWSAVQSCNAWDEWVSAATISDYPVAEDYVENPEFLRALRLEHGRRQKAVEEMTRCLHTPPQHRALRLNYRSLSSLPVHLPPLLKTLELFGNGLNALPEQLPSTLTRLELHNNVFTECLTSLPDSLETLGLNRNRLTRLPASLPSSLRTLQACANRLGNIKNLPPALEVLGVSDNHLTKIEALPESLRVLVTSRNMLSTLPALPANLEELYASDNELIELPELPNSIDRIAVFNNSLYALPLLPVRLRNLNVRGNRLTTLPALPDSLKHLDASHNFLAELPPLPDSLLLLDVRDNPLLRLPAVSKYLIELRADQGTLHATLIYWENQVVIIEKRLSHACASTMKSFEKLPEAPSALEALPRDMLKEIGKHFVPGSKDAFSLACTSKTMHGAMAERIAMDEKITWETRLKQAAVQLERIGRFHTA